MEIQSSKKICEALNCECEATEQLPIGVGKLGSIILFVCSDCISKFLEDELR